MKSSGSSSCTHSDQIFKEQEYARRLGYEVAQELATSVFCGISAYFDKIFPVEPSIIDAVHTTVSKSRGAYNKRRKRWIHYPIAEPVREEDLYPPFVKLVGDILRCLPTNTKKNDLQWHDHHNNPSAARDRYIAELRPAVVATLGRPKPNQDGKFEVPWSRILVPVEVKKEKTEGSALLQLSKYMRLVFRETVDRCFVLGVVLACANMSVYIADRTGVIGSKVFNIHDDPKTLIRVIVGLSTLPFDRLGIDTTMSVIRQRKEYIWSDLKTMPSYAIPWNAKREEHYWVVDMPKPKAGGEFGVMDEEERETFVLYKGVSLSRGGVIRGRATRVWKAWLLEDMVKAPQDRRVFIVKDSWRDDDRRLEGEFYAQVGRADGIAVIRSYCSVRIGSEVDKVTSRIRRNLNVKGTSRRIDMSQKSSHPIGNPKTLVSGVSPDRDRGNVTRYLLAYDRYLSSIDIPECAPQGKTHSRLVMETYGWSIRYALTLEELIQATKDALKGYRTAYEKKVIHRDISVENILITELTVEGKRGVIIDFDHAKILGDPTLHDDPMSGTRPFMSGELLMGSPYFHKIMRIVNSVEEVGVDRTPPAHDFQHDLESVFWVLLWICLCRCGGVRRKALFDQSDYDLVLMFKYLFETPQIGLLGDNKRMIISYEGEFQRCLKCIDDFYEPVKPLLRKLWKILHDGYKRHHFDFTETFDQFITAFNEAEQLLKDNPPPILTEEQSANVEKEIQRRDKDKADWQHSPRPVIKPTRQPMQLVIQENQDEVRDDDDAFADETRDPSTPGADAANLDDLELGRRPARGRGRGKTGVLSTTRVTGIVIRSMSRSSPAAASSSRAESPPSSISSQSTVKPGSAGRTRGGQDTRDSHDDAGRDGNKGKGKAAQGDGGTRGRRGKGSRGRGKGKSTKRNANSEDS